MQTAGPVVAPARSDLDHMAYGQPYSPQPITVADNSGGGAISALRNAFAATPRVYAPGPAASSAYAAMPARYDASYHLDAGDRLRVVVYGQEGLTNTYAI